MMCYRDRTYCTFWKECKLGSECGRALTSEVEEAAHKWRGSEDAPISQYVDKPECFEEEEESNDPIKHENV